MQKFIDRVVTQILDETSLNDLHKIKLVLPSIRSINQVKKSLLNKVDSACILPEITTINEFKIEAMKGSFVKVRLNAVKVKGSGRTNPLPPALS